ncbi:carboxylate-amine ligase [Cellulomonas humilata]|uniref:Putative glutamate--cysteine ligase 2 n=1 Tax=Cellulomonas humilata TaxID=144055 RepID=A0ABU0EF96_9CELL|nr:glutamate--cysteine ligase [Cellulomonas humilata]MDQ0373731.1 carboxylate-amine ligase [Cellulomonas humilata]
MRTLGVEEEFLLVTPEGRPQPVATTVLRHASAVAPSPTDEPGGDLEKEFKQEQIETSTPPRADLAELVAEIRAGRARTDAVARQAGARIAALATAPQAVESTVLPDRRAYAIRAEFAQTARDQLTCGCHVHVSIADEDEGVRILDHLRPWNAVLLALSGNSPSWQGTSTGYASYRSQVWGRWPTAGPTAPFGNASGYRAVIDDLLRTGAILDEGMVYFDARLSSRYPTVEVRVADVCLDADDAALQAALVRGIAETATGEPVAEPRTELLRAATWRAARSGLTGDLVSPLTGTPLPAADVIAQLVDHVRPALTEAGDLEWVERQLATVLRRGNGAIQQLGWRAEGADDDEVVRRAVDRTLAR